MALKTRYKKYLYWTLSLAFVAGILTSIYSLLGGFDEIQIGTSNNNIYSIAGKRIQGESVRRKEEELFREVKELIDSEQLIGDLCLIDYKDDTLIEGEINRFIGVRLSSEVSSIPAGFEVVEISTRQSYIAALTMHPLVMPNSQKIQDKLMVAARQDTLTLRPYSLEVFFPDNSLIVEMFADESK
ncbi:MAG: hypothetical protein OCD76_08340 [Reichenbachiella sp.]